MHAFKLEPAPWTAIGIAPWKGAESVYVFETPLGIQKYRRAHLCSVTALGELDPDLERWRAMFPSDRRHGVDVPAAAVWLVNQCRAAQAKRDAETNGKDMHCAHKRDSG